MALHDGRATVPSAAFDSHILPTNQLFPTAVQEARFDVTELSVSSCFPQLSRGQDAYTAIPAFGSRSFRHSGFYVRSDAGIAHPSELAGKRVGAPERQMTAALWMRGIPSDEYGVGPETIRWRTGAHNAGVRRERLELALPPDMEVRPSEDGQTLQSLRSTANATPCPRRRRPRRSSQATRASRNRFPTWSARNSTTMPGPASFRSCI